MALVPPFPIVNDAWYLILDWLPLKEVIRFRGVNRYARYWIMARLKFQQEVINQTFKPECQKFILACRLGFQPMAELYYSECYDYQREALGRIFMSGNHSFGKWLLERIQQENPENLPVIFSYVCRQGETSFAQWLHQQVPRLEVDYPLLFRQACIMGIIPMVEFLWSIASPQIDLSQNHDKLLRDACHAVSCESRFKYLPLVILLLSWYSTIDENLDLQSAHRRLDLQSAHRRLDLQSAHRRLDLWETVIRTDDLGVVQQMWELNPTFPLNRPFRSACLGGRLEIAQYLYSLQPPESFDLSAIISSCWMNRVDSGSKNCHFPPHHQPVLKWLFGLPLFEPLAYPLFQQAIEWGYSEMARWLWLELSSFELQPQLYQLAHSRVRDWLLSLPVRK